MLALQGYFDGNEVRTLEKIHARKNQKLIITILDEFIDESSLKNGKKQSARGLLSEYANPELQKEEELLNDNEQMADEAEKIIKENTALGFTLLNVTS